MTDASETPAAKRRRLRWISLAEFIAVAGLVIAGASYWDSHRERERTDTARPASVPLLLTATANGSRATLTLKPARSDAVVQTQTLIFPTAVRADAVEITGDARLEAGWIEAGVRKAVPASGDAHPPRLPVGIVTVFVENGAMQRDAAVYDVGYTMHDRLLRGRAVALEGITLVRRTPETKLRAVVDARWAAALQ